MQPTKNLLRTTGTLPRRCITRIGVVLLLTTLVGMTGCKKSGSASETVPASAGDLWEVDPTAGRPAMPGALLAYVNGLDVMVVDGDLVYAGMTPLKVEAKPNGVRAIKLAGNLEAELLPISDGKMDLRFSSGESVPMRKK
jgi:hypothetical protein